RTLASRPSALLASTCGCGGARMNAPNPRLRGNRDVGYILLTVLVVGIITGFLLDHLHTRHLLFSVARERSMTAYEVRKLKEEARHLRLEERIREASVQREEAPE